jgi:hypothetical protein
VSKKEKTDRAQPVETRRLWYFPAACALSKGGRMEKRFTGLVEEDTLNFIQYPPVPDISHDLESPSVRFRRAEPHRSPFIKGGRAVPFLGTAQGDSINGRSCLSSVYKTPWTRFARFARPSPSVERNQVIVCFG